MVPTRLLKKLLVRTVVLNPSLVFLIRFKFLGLIALSNYLKSVSRLGFGIKAYVKSPQIPQYKNINDNYKD